MKEFPTVTIAIPTYNEAADIERVIRGFLATRYPNLIEILIGDGGSTDGTQAIVDRLSSTDPRVKLIHNPEQIQSYALNLMIEACSGEIFLRADAHSDYAPDYVEQCVEALLKSRALNVGGAQRFVAKNAFQSAIALASRSVLGSGGAKYRDPQYNGFADTVYLGCFWRDILVKLGGFRVEAITNQDAELNLRLRKFFSDHPQLAAQERDLFQKLNHDAEKAIYISSDIKAWYYPRKTWKSLQKQYFKYGRGRYLTSTTHTENFQLRGKLPFLVLTGLILAILLDLVFPGLQLPALELLPLGLLLPFLEAFRVNWKFRQSFKTEFWRGDKSRTPSFLSRWILCGVVFLTMPIAHFSGYLYQIYRNRILGIQGW
jgi:glycosyltransferase involved in cell wall biosynthesis